jgi:predicted aspartyl protease
MIDEVRFRLMGGAQPLIVLPASVNGSDSAQFILDTGAGVTLLSTRLAARAGVRSTGTKEGAGAGGRITVQIGSVETLAVGRLTLRDVAVAITDEVARIGSAIGASVDGTLGHSFFRHLRLVVDYAAAVLTLDSEHADPDPAGASFRLAHPSKPLILVAAEVNGAGAFSFAVDTGASTTVISPELARSLGVVSRPAPAMTGGGGMARGSIGVIRSLAIGNARSENVTVMIAEFVKSLAALVGVQLDGIVGYNVLRNFRVGIDYPNTRLSLDPATGTPREAPAASRPR